MREVLPVILGFVQEFGVFLRQYLSSSLTAFTLFDLNPMASAKHTLPYRIIVGLEIHIELNTKTKMFCRCLNDPFHSEPNQNICPVCTGQPGALPVPNKEAVRKSILMGLALQSEIAKLSKWDRKHYFYPDNPKGYQISQYDLPLCLGGHLDLLKPDGSIESTVRFERVHMEDDAGKLLHGGKPGYSEVDFNRAGVPLIEMVSKPDITSPEQARKFLRELRLLARTLGISDADMEKGQMRCDVNINIAFDHEGKAVKTPITEVKNVNSSQAVERSIQIESQRQYDEWMANGPIRKRKNKITCGYDADTGQVQIQRAKEAANDYRYFPEPDIPPIAVYEVPELNPANMTLPELPNATRQRLLKKGLAMVDIDAFLNDPQKRSRLDELTKIIGDDQIKTISNWLLNAPASLRLPDTAFHDLMNLVNSGTLSFATIKPRLEELVQELESATVKTVKEYALNQKLLLEHDEGVVQSAIEKVLSEQKEAVAQYKAGNTKIFGFLVGQVLKLAAGKAQPQKVQESVKKALAK
jgi:aspartyl-tRNA(Asn)/glutamyl-tRNA(Gln) amidotransferase subunit B